MDTARLVGDYELGPKIGSGSFAVVWLAKHRSSGLEVAIKEIDKKVLSPKVRDNLLKEISILSTIDHPNIIRFYEAIETGDRIFLVLEYCSGGDLAGYINLHGKVSEAVAKHFMRQLALGLQVLQEKHFIHRDLKPQNLLLSSKEVTPLLKIGDFWFASLWSFSESKRLIFSLLPMWLVEEGLDIIGVQTVINYACPREIDSYVHRVGRTARAGREGYAVTFVTDNDRSLLKVIAKKVGSKLKSRIIPEHSIVKWSQIIDEMEDQYSAVIGEEREERALRKAEMEFAKAENMIEHRDEIYARGRTFSSFN